MNSACDRYTRHTERHGTGNQLSRSEGPAENAHARTHVIHSSVAAAPGGREGERAAALGWGASTRLHQLETGRGGVLRSSSLLRTAATYEKRHNTE